jgi:hypothetical protein
LMHSLALSCFIIAHSIPATSCETPPFPNPSRTRAKGHDKWDCKHSPGHSNSATPSVLPFTSEDGCTSNICIFNISKNMYRYSVLRLTNNTCSHRPRLMGFDPHMRPIIQPCPLQSAIKSSSGLQQTKSKLRKQCEERYPALLADFAQTSTGRDRTLLGSTA